jgi:hypothetical protein
MLYLYKGVKYEYEKWKTFDGEQASAFYCRDKDLLKEYQTVQFGAKTQEEMHEKIDYYLENVEKQKARRELNMKAAQEFYASMSENKGD